MILYHGSNVAVNKPRIIASDRKLDFGTGFYLTSSLEQAQRWAELTTIRRNSGSKIVSVFEYNEESDMFFKIKRFEKADKDWLVYVSNNRRLLNTDEYDIVIGPVANDKTSPVISLFFAGLYDVEETIKRLMPQKLKDQYAFKSQKAIECLIYKEVIIL